MEPDEDDDAQVIPELVNLLKDDQSFWSLKSAREPIICGACGAEFDTVNDYFEHLEDMRKMHVRE